MRSLPTLLPLLPLLFTLGCAVPMPREESGPPPAEVALLEQPPAGSQVVWGGVIAGAENLREGSRLEVLAYPLESDGRPLHREAEQGRFLGVTDHYLETIDFAPGRLVTLYGTLEGVEQGKVGEAAYRFPRLRIERIRLWPRRVADDRVRFRIGVGLGFGF